MYAIIYIYCISIYMYIYIYIYIYTHITHQNTLSIESCAAG